MQVVFHSPVCQLGGVEACYFWPRYVFEAQLAPVQCCARRCGKSSFSAMLRSQSWFARWNMLWSATSNHGKCLRQNSFSTSCVSQLAPYPFRECVRMLLLNVVCVFGAKIIPAQCSQSFITLWDCSRMLPLFTKFVWSWCNFKAVLRFMLARSQLEARWRMLPLTTKCVWGKSSSSAAFAIELYHVEWVGECYLRSRNVSQARVAPAQCWHCYWNVLNWRRVGECCLWSRNVFEAKVALAPHSWSIIFLWSVLENAISGHEMCPRRK